MPPDPTRYAHKKICHQVGNTAVTGHNLPDKSCVADTAMQIELA